ncbi:MAG: DUF6125 family protein [Thermodesulfobacteriota bacterium]
MASSRVSLDDFQSWDRERLLEYLEFLFHSYRTMDAFWFLNIERDYGLEEACRLNELVWGKVGALAARDLKRRFGDQDDFKRNGDGLTAFVRAIKLFPWTVLVGYEIEAGPEEVLISVPSCPPQEARRQRGLGEYPCQAMHAAEFRGFAAEIDPRLEVACLFAPPDEHPPNLFCRWRFTLKNE